MIPLYFQKTGSIIEQVTAKNLIIAMLIWFVPLITVFPFFGILVGITFVLVIIILFGRMSSQKLGGLTGDVLGATAFVSEMIFLFGLTLYLRLFRFEQDIKIILIRHAPVKEYRVACLNIILMH